MRGRYSTAALSAAMCALALVAGLAQGGGRGNVAPGLFTAADGNKDGVLTRDEWKSAFDGWFTRWDYVKSGSIDQERISGGFGTIIPQPPPAPAGGGRGPQNQTPNPTDVEKMMAALPDRAPAKPKQPRRVLVLAKAAGFVHSSIPLAARTIEEMGKKTGAWSTTITYDPADVNDQNLKQYDAIFLASTTGHFLDDPNDATATAARRKALLDFVRNGKGLAGIHAASDSYHQNRPTTDAPGGGRSADAGAGRGQGRGQGRGNATYAPLATQMIAEGDKDGDKKLTRAEVAALADVWFDKLDPQKSGRVSQQDFPQRYASLMPAPPPAPPQAKGPTGFPIQRPATQLELGPDTQTGTWPEFNKMIGGFFKFHWNDGTVITVKLDEPKHPLNAPFKGQEFEVMDEIYTMGRETYSRENLRVLTSINYAKMSAEDKAKEQYPRPDGDYGLSWIHRDGKGRVFYQALGHSERVYAIKPILEHVLAGVQYVLGDLQVDDSPKK
jgi:type 1 glutamine amidotransferase